jgi:hypothetical protein
MAEMLRQKVIDLCRLAVLERVENIILEQPAQNYEFICVFGFF